MTIHYSVATRTARIEAVADQLNADTNPGKVLLYTAPQPAPGDAVTDQTLLAEVELADPCGTVTNGVLTFAQGPDAMVLADGTPTWFRALDGGSHWVMDGTVGTLGSGADLTIDSTDFFTGGLVRLTGGTLTDPA